MNYNRLLFCFLISMLLPGPQFVASDCAAKLCSLPHSFYLFLSLPLSFSLYERVPSSCLTYQTRRPCLPRPADRTWSVVTPEGAKAGCETGLSPDLNTPDTHAQPPTLNTQHPALQAQHPTLNAQQPTLNAQHWTPNTQHQHTFFKIESKLWH